MNTPTIYTATPADLSPPVQTDSFCVDLVLATDYQKLKDEFKQLAAENVALSKDAQRYRFIRERDMFGSDNESGLLSWEELAELECNEFDDALDARINHPNTGFIELDAKMQARNTPVTDRIVAEAEARGVEKAIAHLEKKFSNIGVQIMNLQWLAGSLREGASE